MIVLNVISKKLANGVDCILLDVKWGDGAFMKTVERKNELAKCMVNIGKSLKKDIKYEITDMNQSLGKAISNILEIRNITRKRSSIFKWNLFNFRFIFLE